MFVSAVLVFFFSLAIFFSNFVNAGVLGYFDSDFVSLYIATSSLPVPGIGHGVFAKYDIPKGAYLCEYVGYVYPQEHYVNEVISLPVKTPDGTPYHLLGTSICSYINDVINPMEYKGENDEELPVFENRDRNAALLYTNFGKVFVVATRDIKAYEEIFMSYGSDFWRNALALFPPYGHTKKVHEVTLPPSAISSDEFLIYSGPSTISPRAGNGMFTRYATPAGTILCDYRGLAIPANVQEPSDKYSPYFVTANNETWKYIGNTICAIVNDCVWIDDAPYTADDILHMLDVNTSTYSIPIKPGFAYNAYLTYVPEGRFLLIASQDIPADTEIFWPYGKQYWDAILRMKIPKLREMEAKAEN